jgi:hypothetical protein
MASRGPHEGASSLRWRERDVRICLGAGHVAVLAAAALVASLCADAHPISLLKASTPTEENR